jgi:DNA polymerase-3 subunit gamma/tau
LLCQPFELEQNQITVHLHNPVQEMMLNNLRSDLTAYLRERVRNTSITLVGVLREAEERKVIYTNREKFDYLVAKNPILKELKDRLGLDTDF